MYIFYQHRNIADAETILLALLIIYQLLFLIFKTLKKIERYKNCDWFVYLLNTCFHIKQ